jgi:hypothetical protein
MKKRAIVILGMLTIGMVGFSQAVKDRQVIPVAVNLNQVLRMTITNGGNIEFVFNSIDDYRLGLSGAGAANPAASGDFYITDFNVASSARWILNYGSEEATFVGTDDPTATLALNNVGYTLSSEGTHLFEAGIVQGAGTGELWSAPTENGTAVAGLEAYPVALIDDNGLAAANAGDGVDNSFQMIWRCGTGETSGNPNEMEAESILNQDPSPAPDRYVTNVLFELGIK